MTKTHLLTIKPKVEVIAFCKEYVQQIFQNVTQLLFLSVNYIIFYRNIHYLIAISFHKHTLKLNLKLNTFDMMPMFFLLCSLTLHPSIRLSTICPFCLEILKPSNLLIKANHHLTNQLM